MKQTAVGADPAEIAGPKDIGCAVSEAADFALFGGRNWRLVMADTR